MGSRLIATLAAVAWAAASWAQAPQQAGPAATRAGLEIGLQGSRYKYEEPDFAELEGNRIGITGSYTSVATNRWYSRFEGRYSYGRLDYTGSGTMSGVPDQLLDARVLVGRDLERLGAVWSPYLGIGVRFVHNDLRGTTSTGAIGYRRQSRYFYFPLGLTVRMRMGGGWVLAPQLEYDAFSNGDQRTYLSDADPSLADVSNNQRRGYGNRGRLAFEHGAWSFAAWYEYWNVRDSDIQPIGGGFAALEPANNTKEYGVELRYRF
jgi:hypothetical protein